MSLTLALYLAVYTSGCPLWVLLAFGTGNYSGASLLYLAAMLALVPGRGIRGKEIQISSQTIF